MIATRCSHRRFIPMRVVTGCGLDDHETTYGHCSDCDGYYVLTWFVSGRQDWSPMTAAEIVRETDAYDPTLYCTACTAKRFTDCTCGPTAENH